MRQTKLELVQINSRLAREAEALRVEVADLKLKLEMYERPTHRIARHMPAWQVARAEQMAAARALAMQTHSVVKV